MHHSFANQWIVIYALGIATFEQPLVVVPTVLATIAAHAVYRWTARVARHEYVGGARVAQRVIVGGVLATAIVGLAATSTAVATSYSDGSEHLRDSPLATFFLLVAILAWRALVRPTPRATAAIALVVYATWIPFVAWNALQALDHVPEPTDWQQVAEGTTLWIVVAAGGVLCWIATLATTRAMPGARVRGGV